MAFNSIFSVEVDILERGVHYTLNVRSREKQLVLFSWESLFCYISRLSFQQQQKNNRSESKQSTRYLIRTQI